MAYDAIVVGLGAMGSAAVYQLAKRGAKVLGIDRFRPPHDLGSSHGETRITRQAIGEGEEYVPLAMRSHKIWREIESETGADLLTVTGGLIMSSTANTNLLHGSGNFIEQTIACAKKYGIEHSLLTAGDIRRQFPQFAINGDEVGYYENEAGFLRPENCIKAQLELAQKYGAEIHFDEKVFSFNGNEVVTEKGKYQAAKIIISAGPWVNEFVSEEFRRLFKIYRQVLYWFQLREDADNYLVGNLPIFIWQFGRWADDFIYGFPALSGKKDGLKLAAEQHLNTTDPDSIGDPVSRETVSAAEIEKMYRQYIGPHFPGLTDRCVQAVSCLYTVTPDDGFVIDRHPHDENVIIASPCSGHGFKHSAAVGEILAELALEGKTKFDIGKFSFDRFL
ncbi:MAG TPA: N-methyl-L-tryptophan oxidase [Pyrinomonadaceae bacterium]|jgi:sarcosine oxidase|nr:N-methyl-L-tryptophan oxidase [Pyrinomonadaceae bacterium]